MTAWPPEAPVRPRCRSAWAFHEDGAAPDASQCIFVFGSNLAGRHGKGAALLARTHYGARYGLGRGQVNRSYALPTKDERLRVLPLVAIRREIHEFVEHATHMDQELFFVTRVGCGLAAYSDAQIAPMFARAPANCSFAEQWRMYLVTEIPWEHLISDISQHSNPSAVKDRHCRPKEVTRSMVLKRETMASGHADYHRKFAQYCRELATLPVPELQIPARLPDPDSGGRKLQGDPIDHLVGCALPRQATQRRSRPAMGQRAMCQPCLPPKMWGMASVMAATGSHAEGGQTLNGEAQRILARACDRVVEDPLAALAECALAAVDTMDISARLNP